MFSSVVLFGLFHGLIVLPVLLSLIGPAVTRKSAKSNAADSPLQGRDGPLGSSMPDVVPDNVRTGPSSHSLGNSQSSLDSLMDPYTGGHNGSHLTRSHVDIINCEATAKSQEAKSIFSSISKRWGSTDWEKDETFLANLAARLARIQSRPQITEL